jgi:hypothetical protein
MTELGGCNLIVLTDGRRLHMPKQLALRLIREGRAVAVGTLKHRTVKNQTVSN